MSSAKCDAVNSVCWDFGIRFLATNSEDHKGVGRDDGGGIHGFTQPAVRTSFIHFNSYLRNSKRKNTPLIQKTKVRMQEF